MPLEENNYFGQLFKAIMERIETEVPEIKWVCEDLGQLEEFDFRPSVKFPCALIDFPNTNYSGQSETIQRGRNNITIRLGFNPYSTAHFKKNDFSLNASLKRFAIEQKVVDALHGWDVEDICQPLNRLSVNTEKRGDGMKVRVLTFDTEYEDDSQQEESTKVAASVKLNFKP